jgi:hypothetical protein
MNRARSVFVACLTAVLAVSGASFAADNPEDAAQAAAETWLRLVDGGNYPASWDQAARQLKGAVKQGEWAQMAETARSPLGNVVSRKLKSREYTEKPPTTRTIGGRVYTWGGGPGRYVVLRYETVFANKAAAEETVVPMADPDGAWRVSAYDVR